MEKLRHSNSLLDPNNPLIVVEFWNCAPHLETSIEIALNHSRYSKVYYCFLGSAFDYNEIYRLDNRKGREYKYLESLSTYSSSLKVYNPTKNNLVHESCLEATNILKELFDYQDLHGFIYNGFPLGKLVLSNLIDRYKVASPDVFYLRKEIATMISAYISVRRWMDNFLLSHIGDVCIFNGRYLLPAAIKHSAATYSRNVIYHERGGNPSLYMLSNQPVQSIKGRKAMHEQIWNSKSVSDDEALVIGAQKFDKKKQRQNESWYSFASEQIEGSLPFLPQNKQLIVYFGGSSHEVRSYLDENVFPPGPWPDQFSLLADIIGIISVNPQLFLAIRVHPHVGSCSIEEQCRWSRLNIPDNAILISHDSDIDTYALLNKANSVIVESSSMGIESLSSKKPTLICGTTPYNHIVDICHRPQSYKSLEQMILNPSSVSYEQVNRCRKFQYCDSLLGMSFCHVLPNGLFDADIPSLSC